MIDGLDEFDGREDHDDEDIPQERELLEFLRNISQQKNLKTCLSSRPWLSFKKEFGTNEKFYFDIHQLTEQDMRIFIEGTLQRHPDFIKLSKMNAGYLSLINDMLEAAQGVFLWVHLAWYSLLDGIRNEDRLSDLSTRLRQLPRSLEGMYNRILTKIPSRYSKQAARYLLIASKPRRIEGLLFAYCFVDDAEYSKALACDIMEPSQFIDMFNATETRILACTGGLLDVPPPIQSLKTDKLWQMTMELTHRSVGDFLRTPNVNNALLNKAELLLNIEDLIAHRIPALLNCMLSYIKFLQQASSPDTTMSQYENYGLRLYLFRTISAYADVPRQ